jgi:acyl-coenzyme A synthetase/AMP-(fatty) acid ligase
LPQPASRRVSTMPGPVLMVTADGGSRMGKAIAYKPLVDESIRLSKHPPAKVLIYRRGPRSQYAERGGEGCRLGGACAAAPGRLKCPAPGSNPPSRRISFTRPAPPANQKAYSATSADTPWPWQRR